MSSDGGEEMPSKTVVIVTMPNSDAYILLEPAPRDKRSPGRSDFVLAQREKNDPHKALHFEYGDRVRREAFKHALPMYAEEADEVRQRIANGEKLDVYTRWMANKRRTRRPAALSRRADLRASRAGSGNLSPGAAYRGAAAPCAKS